jgi:hypothetical protein
MKKLAILILVALGAAALGCGHSNIAPPIQTQTGGKWEAQLIGGEGQAALLNFVTAFTVTNTDGGTSEPLDIADNGFGFINLQSCFVTQTPSGSADLTTSTTNLVTGSMIYTVQSVNPPGNTLTLFTTNSSGTPVGGVNGTANNGALAGGIVNGQWTLTGGQGDPSCVGGGTFVMCQGTPTCTVP